MNNSINLMVEYFKKRNLLKDISKISNFYENKKYSCYMGIDPTAENFHLGNLWQIVTLARTYNFNFKPIFLIGGATCRIGDPSGKNEQRKNWDLDIAINNKNESIKNLKLILENIKNNFIHNFEYEIFDNSIIYKDFDFITFTQDILSNIRLSPILSQTHFKNRLDTTGLSLNEVIYPALQSYDFYYLNHNYNCIMQLGGSDQWGNIMSGIHFIHKYNQNKKYTHPFALVTNLLLDKNGNKFGKTAEEKIWVTNYDKNNNKKYLEDVHQFCLNLDDIYIENFLNYFCLEDSNEIKEILENHNKNPKSRIGQLYLSKSLLKLIAHDQKEVENQILYKELIDNNIEFFSSKGEPYFINLLGKIFNNSNIKTYTQDTNSKNLFADLYDNQFSKKQIKTFIAQGSIQINDKKISQDTNISQIKPLFNKYYISKKGKKDIKIFKI